MASIAEVPRWEKVGEAVMTHRRFAVEVAAVAAVALDAGVASRQAELRLCEQISNDAAFRERD